MKRLTSYLCAATVLMTIGAKAEELRFAIGVPDNFTMVDAMRYFKEKIPERTDGEITARLFTGSSLLSFTETFSGIRDGIADMGYVVSSYHRAELKETNLIGDLGMTGSNLVVMAGAASEYCLTSEECRQEYLNEGQVFLGFTSTAPYRLISTTPIKSLEDLKGKRIRSFSAFGRWAEAVDAVQVNLPAGDIYEGFSQGTIDVNTHPYEAFVTLSLKDVAKYVTDLPLGTFFINALFNTNVDVWRGWDEETRLAVLNTAAEGIGRAAAATYAGDIESHEKGVADMGVEVVTPDAEVIAATEAFVEEDVPGIAELNETKFGVTDAQAKIDRFRGLVDKWEGLVAEIDASAPDQVADLFRDNIYGDTDKASYGM
ncbi:C4-dicarboxylate TRAP transporter substrate-binding protein [Pseudohoeflea coraliihabitans]|uniref:C4-dicarboxylate TRAP transporter substrate-binding protein n=1 Tax=Pseudohoeflea coraliihabitans TaxID=2860393 RepID=A0ABS6WU51_9HYPH|nr:C4-dicarboxylate TRAP transporter substrate-binding protein [Pseudohoeflea sp. DP4N28-3]MBW3098967.1 C4-dicarboxylate TRAP transporter substrate-binding protein [Pseudohoeflea sp. DP4N28-3]